MTRPRTELWQQERQCAQPAFYFKEESDRDIDLNDRGAGRVNERDQKVEHSPFQKERTIQRENQQESVSDAFSKGFSRGQGKKKQWSHALQRHAANAETFISAETDNFKGSTCERKS